MTEFNIIRAAVTFEGQSEDAFVKRILSPYILSATDNRVLLQPRIVVTLMDRRRGKKYTGGLVSFSKAWGDISKTINNGPDTAPSKRLLNTIAYHKGENAPDILEKIGIEKMISMCPHFCAFVNALKGLANFSS